jgi:dihydropteroate synthase
VCPATRLLAVADGPEQAARAWADGADLIDVRAATPGALASIRASLPSAVLWPGQAGAGSTGPEPFDADQLAGPRPASVVAAAAIGTWLGAPVIRSRHTRATRRAIDMTLVIAGTRRPAVTLRGLA